MNELKSKTRSVLVTGAGGYIGSLTTAALAQDRRGIQTIVAADLREPKAEARLDGVEYVACDIRSPEMAGVLKRHAVDAVVHLAAIVTPGRKSDRELEFSVDVLGTRNLVECCLRAGTTHLSVTSSGAAYGYHADNPPWLDEDDALRGNPEFAYSDHKRQVERMLAQYRREHPELKQLIFRPGTVLGAGTSNQITNLFEKKSVMGLKGSDTPFVFIWDQDVVAAIVQGVHARAQGIYNMAGDGVLTLREIAEMMGKPYRELPVGLVRAALWVMKKLGVTQYGPEQVDFLRYRPVLANRRLKEEFGYTPRKTSREVFEYYLEHRSHGS